MVAVIPLQDLLELGNEARMNVPGRPEDNWTWRYTADMIHPDPIAWLAELTAATARWEDPNRPPADDAEPAATEDETTDA